MTGLIEKQLFGTVDKVADAIKLLRALEPNDGYYLAFSGGKDSVTIKALADMAGVKYDAHYSVTTIDPPELVRFIRNNHTDVHFEKPLHPYFQEFKTNGMPLRTTRWCCKLLKERAGKGRTVLTGVRADESIKRKGRKKVENCLRGSGKRYVHVIFDWTNNDVWDFIKQESLPYCSLYNEGYKRIGCIACPMKSAKLRQQELERWPKYKRAFRNACLKYYNKGLPSVKRWESGEAMWQWWISDESLPQFDDDELGLFA